MDNKLIHLISNHSNLSSDTANKILGERIYNGKVEWQGFLHILLLSLGIGFIVAGIIFFFAYNWADLHKFYKLGLVQVLILGTTLASLSPKLNTLTKNIVLTGASVLVGVLFAVFGQIYQTGANAYDFFFGWIIFITLWVLISNFYPLWTLYLLLLNTTVILYAEQVAGDWTDIFVNNILFTINLLALGAFLGLKHFKNLIIPSWFIKLLTMTCVGFSTIGIVQGILGDYGMSFIYILILGFTFYTGIVKYSLQQKSIFYLSNIVVSAIIIISTIFVEISHDAGTFLFISLADVGIVTFAIVKLIELQKRWNNE